MTINFGEPAIYRIKIRGQLSETSSDRLGGMQITIDRSTIADNEPIVTLVGKIEDQAALSGVLNALYEWRMTILSVQVLDEVI